MSEEYDFSAFDEPAEDVAEKQEYDFSAFDEPKKEEKSLTQTVKSKATDILKGKNPNGEPQMGRAEAGAISFGQGASMGLAPIASGAVGFTDQLVRNVGDKLGLTTDAELESGISTEELPGLSPKLREKLKGQTHKFEIKDDLNGLLDAYYSSRDAQKRAQNTAFEEYPVQSIAMNIAGAIPTTIATAGLGQTANAGRVANVASKVLPNAKTAQIFDAGSKLGRYGNAIATGMREGAKAGAITGFGNGDAKLLEGEIGETGKELADSTIGGTLIGGIVPAVLNPTVGAVKGIVNHIPGVEGVKTAFRGGAAGINLDEDSANSAIKTHSKVLLDSIKQKFKAAGMEKASALDYADEIGLRVDAGEAFDDVMDDIIKHGAAGADIEPADMAEKLRLYKTLKGLRDGSPDKLQGKIDAARAKTQARMEQKGYQLLDETNTQSHVQDFIPESEAGKKIATTKQTYQKINNEPADALEVLTGGASDKDISKPVEKILQALDTENPIPINEYDLQNLSLRDIESLKGILNRQAGDLKGPAVGDAQIMARRLAGQLRDLSEEAMETAGKNSGNKEMHNIFNALREMGIDDNVMTNSKPRQNDMVNSLQRLTRGSDDIKTDQVFEYLKNADSKTFGDYEQTSKFLNKFRDAALKNTPNSSSAASGMFGSAINKVNVLANKAGGVVHPVAEAGKKFYNMSSNNILALAERMGLEKSSTSFAGPLKAAASADERKRSAILYGLYQQPAFREMYQSLGDSVNEGVSEMLPDADKE